MDLLGALFRVAEFAEIFENSEPYDFSHTPITQTT